MNLLCSYAAPMAYQNVIRMAVPLTFSRWTQALLLFPFNAVMRIHCTLKETEWSPSASLVMWTTRTIRNIVMCGLSTSMSRTPSPTSGSVWAMCLAIASHVVITWRGWAMAGTSRKGNSVLICSITVREGYLRRLTTSTQLNTRISHMNLFQGYHSLTRLLVAWVHRLMLLHYLLSTTGGKRICRR